MDRGSIRIDDLASIGHERRTVGKVPVDYAAWTDHDDTVLLDFDVDDHTGMLINYHVHNRDGSFSIAAGGYVYRIYVTSSLDRGTAERWVLTLRCPDQTAARYVLGWLDPTREA